MTLTPITDWLIGNISSLVFFTVAAAVAVDLSLNALRNVSDRDDWSAIRLSVIAGVSFAATKTIASKLFVFAFALWVHDRFALFDLPMSAWWTWLLLFVLRDAVYYWVHRAEHRFAGLWASHMIHHSSTSFTFTTAVRMPWMEVLYKPVIYLWAPIIGFHPAAAAVFGGLVLIVGQVQHTELGRRLPKVEGVLVTPSVHRVHHGSNPEYLDKNFGSILTIWDHLFGTFEPEVAPVRYGLTDGKTVTSTRDVLVGGYPELAARIRTNSSVGEQLKLIASRPS